MMLKNPAAYLAALNLFLFGFARAQTILSIIQGDPDLLEFAEALTAIGADGTLVGEFSAFTVFAPVNDAINEDKNFVTYLAGGWDGHLKSSVENHIVQDVVLSTQEEIFDGTRASLISMAGGELNISQELQQIQGVEILQDPIYGSNGVVHKVGGILKNDWRRYQLRNAPEVDGRLAVILELTSFDAPLQQFIESGTNFLAPQNTAFDSRDQVIRAIVAGFEDRNEVDGTTGDLLYTLLDQNIYKEDLGTDFEMLVLPRNPVAHMWVTIDDSMGGLLRFNDAKVLDQFLTENGVGHVTDRIIVPPGIGELIKYTADSTSIAVSDLNAYLQRSEWNLRNLSESVGTGQGSFTLLAPLDPGFDAMQLEEDVVRLSTHGWQRHLWDLLGRFIIEPALTDDELKQMTIDAGGEMSYPTLSGYKVPFSITSDDTLLVDGGKFLAPSNMRGVDGLIHLVSGVPSPPPSLLYNVYEQTKMNPEMSIVTTYIDALFLGLLIGREAPMTFFSPPNDAWFYDIPLQEMEDVLKNHMFLGHLFDNVLLELDGQEIMSVNNKKWLVTVLNGTVYIGDNPVSGSLGGYTNATFLAGPESTNILARNGVIHHVNSLFLDFPYATLAGAPTPSPFVGTSSPTSMKSPTVLSLIQTDPDLSDFAAALSLSGLDSFLAEPYAAFTVFAPVNDGVNADIGFSTYVAGGWDGHLKSSVENHIVNDAKLVWDEIFDGARTELLSLAGILDVSQELQKIQGAEVLLDAMNATNGIVHKVGGVLKNGWRRYQLRDVEIQTDLDDGLATILNLIEFDAPLHQFNETGATFVAPRNSAFITGDPVIIAELEDPNEVERTIGDLLYTVLDQNMDSKDLGVNFQQLVLPRNPVAHMWVTVEDGSSGILRFNDASVVSQHLTENGVLQITDKILVPPGIAELLSYTTSYTNIKVSVIEELIGTSGWNKRNLSKSIGIYQGEYGLTLLAPLDTAFDTWKVGDLERLKTTSWIRHLWNFLEHLIIEPALTEDELKERTIVAGGNLSYETLSGFDVTFSIADGDKLMVDDREFLELSDMRGVDGLIHIVSNPPLPPSILYGVYEQTQMNPDMSIVTNLINRMRLDSFFKEQSPMTFFSPTSDAWLKVLPIRTEKVEDVLMNHVFSGLLFDDVLLGMDGQNITSFNGNKWLVTVSDDGTIYIGDDGITISRFTNATFLPGGNSTNILARNGVIHHVDSVFMDFNYSNRAAPSQAPTPAPTASSRPTTTVVTNEASSSSSESTSTAMPTEVASAISSSTSQSPTSPGSGSASIHPTIVAERSASFPSGGVSPLPTRVPIPLSPSSSSAEASVGPTLKLTAIQPLSSSGTEKMKLTYYYGFMLFVGFVSYVI